MGLRWNLEGVTRLNGDLETRAVESIITWPLHNLCGGVSDDGGRNGVGTTGGRIVGS